MAPTSAAHHPTAEGDIVVPETHDIEVRSLSVNDLRDALESGYADFRARPSYILALGLVYPLGAALAAGIAIGYEVLPLVFPVAAGLALMGPFAAIVLYEISRRREQGLDFSWGDMGAVFRRASTWGVGFLIVALVTVFFVWLAVAQAIFDATLGYAGYMTPLEFISRLFTTPEGWTLILVGNGVGFLFAAAVLATNVVSFPMLLDRKVGAPAAVVTSLRVAFKNPLTIALWGFIIAVSLAAGALVFLVGLGVVVPVLGHASWRLYRKAVGWPS